MDVRSNIIVGHQKIPTLETIISVDVILLTSAATHLSVGFTEFTCSPAIESSLNLFSQLGVFCCLLIFSDLSSWPGPRKDHNCIELKIS